MLNCRVTPSCKVAFAIALLAVFLMGLAQPAAAQSSVEWVQLGGSFRVQASRAGTPSSPLCVHGLSCSCPGSRNYCGQHRNGAEVLFWKDGCNRPPITIQCVIRTAGGPARPAQPASNQQEPFGQNFDGWKFSQAPDKTGVICRAFAGNGFNIGRLGDGKVYVSVPQGRVPNGKYEESHFGVGNSGEPVTATAGNGRLVFPIDDHLLGNVIRARGYEWAVMVDGQRVTGNVGFNGSVGKAVARLRECTRANGGR